MCSTMQKTCPICWEMPIYSTNLWLQELGQNGLSVMMIIVSVTAHKTALPPIVGPEIYAARMDLKLKS